jgi:DNA (cytosine-5)-methyltransferase 1
MSYTRNIGSNRGKPRLWLEGAILTECGFKHGQNWHLECNDDGSLTLLTSEAGTRRVAGTPERPIIDINNGKILLGLGPKVELRRLGDGIIHVENVK